MAVITIKIPNINGEATTAGHTDELEAFSVGDAVLAASSSGKASLSELALGRYKDRATPKLAEACATGANLGQIEVFVFKNTETGQQVFMKYTLTETYVSRIEHDTAESSGGAYLPHLGYSNAGPPSWRPTALALEMTVNDVRSYSQARARPIPLYNLPDGAYSNDEVERVWLNAATITWTYTPFSGGVAGGAVEQGWNLQTGVAL